MREWEQCAFEALLHHMVRVKHVFLQLPMDVAIFTVVFLPFACARRQNHCSKKRGRHSGRNPKSTRPAELSHHLEPWAMGMLRIKQRHKTASPWRIVTKIQ